MKQYVGISRDHSGSMQGVAKAALQDYNSLLDAIQQNSKMSRVDTDLLVVQCGIRDGFMGTTVNKIEVDVADISSVKPITSYPCNGNNTPLFDSVDLIINRLKQVRDYNSKDVSFLVMVCTDGANNAGYMTGHNIARKIKELEATDKWTFTFRVPTGYKSQLTKLGISEHNILEFEATSEAAFNVSTVHTQAAVGNFYLNKSKGINATRSFYHEVDTSQLDTKTVRQELTNVSKKVRIVKVNKDEDGMQISAVVEAKTGGYVLGSAYYQLTKKEKFQEHKRIIVWDKLSGEYYTGAEAKTLLGLNHTGEIKIAPASFPQFEVFVQSTSTNRKLVGGTKVVVYKE